MPISPSSIDLTLEEQAYLRQRINTLTKRSRQWRWQRRCPVILFVIGVLVFICAIVTASKLADRFDSSVLPIYKQESVDAESVLAFIDAKLLILRLEFLVQIKALIFLTMATGMFVYAVANWQRDKRDLVEIKLLSSLLPTDAEPRTK